MTSSHSPASPLERPARDALISLVRDVAQRLIVPRFRNLGADQIDAKADPTDFVTVADQEAEAAITSGVEAILPGAAVVGEEAVAADPGILARIGSADTCVIIDPVDGTGNFATGLSVFGVILAVVRGGETVFGLLYDPVCDDWVEGAPGEGAFYATPDSTRRALHTRAPRPPEEALGLLPLDLHQGEARSALLARFDDTLILRSLRCSCHEYRMLVMGQADFILSASLQPWDHAAGILIVEEAGGYVRTSEGARYRPTMTSGTIIAASSPEMAAHIRGRA